jgi:hypothetical protein
MDEGREYFEKRAAQCRRLAASMGDARTTEILTKAALEFDAKAAAASPTLPDHPRTDP